MLLRDIRDYIDTLAIADHVYCGILPNKEDKSIGVYNMKGNRAPINTVGGSENRSYERKAISLLIHWNQSPTETEIAAMSLYKILESGKNIKINGHTIIFCKLLTDEPIPVDTDENGIFEYVIECYIYYDKEE